MRPVAAASAAARATSSLHSVLLTANLCGVALLLLLHLRSDGGDQRAAASNGQQQQALGALDAPQVMAGEGNRELLSELAEGAGQACATSEPINAGNKELLQWSEQQYRINVGRRNAAVGKDPVKFVMDWFKMTEGRPYKARAAFMFEVFAPAYPCLMEERLGTWLDGGKWVCRPSLLNASSVVYSIGSDGKDSFEEEIFSRFKSRIHVFDHTLTPRKKAKVERKKAYKFHPIGLAVSSNESASLSSFKDLTTMLGHSFVDIFKVDCESCEYDVIPSILDGYTTPPFGQLLIEIHDLDRSNADRLTRFLHKIESHGYPMALSHSSILNLIPATISSDSVAGGTSSAGSIPSGRLLPSSTISSSLRHVLTPSQSLSSASHNAASSLFPSPLHSFHHVSLPRTTTAGAAPAALSAHPRAMLPQTSPFPQASRATSASPDQVALAASATPTSILRSDKDAQSFSNAPQLKERSAQVLSDLRKASAVVAVSTAFALSAGCCSPGAALALDQLPPPVPPSESQVAVSTTNSAVKSGLLADEFISQLESIPPAPALATSSSATPASLTRQVSLTSAGSSGRVVSPEAQEEAKAMLVRQLEEQDRLRNADERMCDAVLSPVKQGIPGPDSSSPSRSRSVTWADCAADFPADVMVPLSLSPGGSFSGGSGDGGSGSGMRSSSGSIVAEPAVYMGPVGGGATAASAAMGGVATGGPIAATEVSFAGAAAASLTLESAAAAAIASSSGGLSAKLAVIMGQSLQHFGVGGVAGAVGAAAVYPLDTIKTRMQAQRKIKESDSDSDDSGRDGANGAEFHSAAGSSTSTLASTSPSPSASQAHVQYRDEWDCFLRMVREEGPAALYSGLGAQLVGIAPEKAIKLTVNEVLLAMLESTIPGARLWVLEIIAGGGGGFCQVVFTNPVEIVKVRMQARKKIATGSSASSSDSEAEGAVASASASAAGASGAVLAEPQQQKGKTSWQVVQELGIRGLYSGSSVTLARDVPSTALFFACYAALKQVMPDQTFIDGCLAAVPAAYLVTPMDVVKTRMQMEPEEGKEAYVNAWACVKEIVEEEGLGALFKGGIARVLRMSPQFGITLMLYDMLSQ
ncbi:unnamed protein product [Closterium sp. Naga37s-1]|nr:unnamed protein product [Closterium sp. Naga37s-1]